MSSANRSLLDLALKSVERGVSTIPVFGKGGGFKWKQYQERLPTEHELRRMFSPNGHGEPTGIAAIFCKATWQAHPHLCMLEIEARHRVSAEPWLNVHLPDWRNGLLVESGGGSLHIYLMSPEPIRTKTYKWGEVRGQNSIGLLPGSIHPTTGKPYYWLHRGRPQTINPYSLPLPGLVPKKRAYEDLADGIIYEHEGRNMAITSFVGLLHSKGFDKDTIRATAWAMNEERCSPPLDRDEFDAIIESVTKNEPGDPGTSKDTKGVKDARGATYKFGALSDDESIEKGRIRANAITPRRLRWLWQPYLSLGKYGEVVGDGGLGKGIFTADLCARVTRGWDMPGQIPTGLDGPRGVVWLQIEDTIDDTIVPRLIAAGADLERVFIRKTVLTANGERPVDIQADLGIIRADCKAVNAALLVIDPVTYFLPDWADAHVDKSTRKALTPLVEVVQELDIVTLGIRHINKTPSGNASDRGTGSKAFTNLARFSLAFGKDPQDDTGYRRVMAVTKQNTGAPAKSWAYAIVDASTPEYEAGKIEWLGESDITADELLGTPADRLTSQEMSKVGEAVYFLQETLKDDGRKAKDMVEEAKRLGISDRTIDRAKKQVGIVARRIGFGSSGEWFWYLPGQAPDEPKSAKTPKGANQNNGAHSESGTLWSDNADVVLWQCPLKRYCADCVQPCAGASPYEEGGNSA